MTKTWNGVQYDHHDRGAEQAAKHGIPRSPHWEKCKHDFEQIHPKKCAFCNGTKNVALHHKKPFHLHPELELHFDNLIWLCENSPEDHHLHVGHLGNFKNFNPNVVADCEKNQALLKKNSK